MNSDGANTPPEPPDADGQGGCHDLAGGQYQQEPYRVSAVECVVEDRVVHAVELWDGEQQQAQDDPADRGAGPFGAAAPDPVAEVFDRVEGGLETQPDQGGDHREQADEQVVVGVG